MPCVGFVQTNNSVVIGGALANVSSQGGTQAQITLSFIRDTGGSNDYWLSSNGAPVAYYPSSLYSAKGLANGPSEIDFGGEIINDDTGGVHTRTQMGSGHFPSEGYQHAAYIKNIRYWDLAGNNNAPSGLTRDVTNATYYDLNLLSSTDPAWGQYFYFGGLGNGGMYAYSYWLPVISHTPGAGGTQWRSDVGVLNPGSSSAGIEFQLYAGGTVLTMTQSVRGNAQVIDTDLAGQLGFTTGSGALQVLSTQPLVVTSRTYNLASSGFTYGQGYDGIASSSALGAGQSGYLPQLVQTGVAGQVGTYRTNIGVTNGGGGAASVTVTVFTGDGTQAWSDTRSYDPGQFYQYQEPYRIGAGLTNVSAGYAVVTVNSGSGVDAYASVIDNGSGDPTTENFKQQQ